MISDKFTIREHNEATVLEQIILNKQISRAELATITRLNKASVSSITKKLLDEKLIVETGIGDSSDVGGRKPILLTFNPYAALVISIDIGTDYLEGILSYLDGEIIYHLKERDTFISSQNVLPLTLNLINKLSKKIPDTPHQIIGATVAIHGSVLQQKIIYTPNYSLHNGDFVNELSETLNFPIYLQNEANLAALGEYAFTSHKSSLISLSIHSGIGAGIVENGVLKIGHQGKAGEFGHTILFPHGKKCPCGNHGCLERYVSQSAIYTQIADRLSLKNINSDTITTLLLEKNNTCTAIIDEAADFLSIGINNLISTFDPEIIIVNSSICSKNPHLITQIEKNLVGKFAQNVPIKNSPLQNKATLLGGVVNTTQNFLNITNLKFI